MVGAARGFSAVHLERVVFAVYGSEAARAFQSAVGA
jgi:hypothetical protein